MGHAFEPQPALGAEHLERKTGASRRHGAEIAGHPLFHAEQDRGGVVGIDLGGAAEALRKYVIDRSAQIDHAVDGMHAHRHQPPARRLVLIGAPMAGIDEQHIGKRHRRFDMQDGAEFAGTDHLAQLGHLGMNAAIVAERQRNAGLGHSGDGFFRFAFCQRERLFAVDVLFRRGRGDHLRAMHGMRRGKHDGIDLRIGQQRVVIPLQPKTVFFGKGLDLRRDGACRTGDETDRVAVFGRFNERLAPPAEPNDGGIDHLLLPRPFRPRFCFCVLTWATPIWATLI